MSETLSELKFEIYERNQKEIGSCILSISPSITWSMVRNGCGTLPSGHDMELYSQTHSSCGFLYKTRTRTIQPKFQHGGEELMSSDPPPVHSEIDDCICNATSGSPALVVMPSLSWWSLSPESTSLSEHPSTPKLILWGPLLQQQQQQKTNTVSEAYLVTPYYSPALACFKMKATPSIPAPSWGYLPRWLMNFKGQFSEAWAYWVSCWRSPWLNMV